MLQVVSKPECRELSSSRITLARLIAHKENKIMGNKRKGKGSAGRTRRGVKSNKSRGYKKGTLSFIKYSNSTN